MTCIVGITSDDGTITMGGDSAGISGWDVTVRTDPKVFLKDDMLIGYTSSFRMGQLLRFNLTVPTVPKRKGDYEFMCTNFVDAVRECFEDGGYMAKEKEREEGGLFLVGWRRALYRIDSDFQVGTSAESFEAIGCGEPYALGALFAYPQNKDPKKIVEIALTTAEHFSAGVRGPFTIHQLRPE